MYSERYLVESLKERLDPYFEKIWIHRKPSASDKFIRLAKERFGDVPLLQPEFDMVFRTFDGELNAIEAKQLNRKTNGFNMPYYRGIGQAIALQRFGFDHVGLWLFVSNTVTDEIMHKYGAAAWYFIRNEIKLPIEYSYFKVIEEGEIPRFQVMQYKNQMSGFELMDIDSPEFRITWKQVNPIRNSKLSIEMRKLTEIYLEEMI